MTHFDPRQTGWVVRSTRPLGDKTHTSWWYGPHHGFGTTHGQLDYSVRVWPTRAEAEKAIRSVYGRVQRGIREPERVSAAVAFAIAEAKRREAEVLATDRPDRAGIAEANRRVVSYLRGRRRSPR